MGAIRGNTIRRFTAAAMVLLGSAGVLAKSPDCTNPEAWPAGMAFTYLKNSGLLDNDSVDSTRTKVSRLASEKIGKDLYRQVHLVHFFKKSGEIVDAITVNLVSHQECSMSDVDVYVVSKPLGKKQE